MLWKRRSLRIIRRFLKENLQSKKCIMPSSCERRKGIIGRGHDRRLRVYQDLVYRNALLLKIFTSVTAPLSPVPFYFSSLSLLCTALHYMNTWNWLCWDMNIYWGPVRVNSIKQHVCIETAVTYLYTVRLNEMVKNNMKIGWIPTRDMHGLILKRWSSHI